MQFHKNSGYVEDAATGIAASTLAFALLEMGLLMRKVRSHSSRGGPWGFLQVLPFVFRKGDNGEVVGCWIGGTAVL